VGFKYLSWVFTGQIDSRVIQGLDTIYSATAVYKDYQLYNYEAGQGILGLGPESPLWYTYTDPDTNTATYSISIARIPWSYPETNITLGGVPSSQLEYYANKESMTISAQYL